MESRWFEKKISAVAEQLKFEIRHSGVRGDNYDSAKNYLKQQQFSVYELEKLHLLMVLQEQKAKHYFQTITLVATFIFSILIALLSSIYGALVGSFLGGVLTISFSGEKEELKKQVLKEIISLSQSSASEIKTLAIFIMFAGAALLWLYGRSYYKTIRESLLLQAIIKDIE